MRELHLFAGAGGGILGGMLLGHTCVCAVEIESYCRRVLLQRQRDGILPKFPIWDDIRTFDGKPWRERVDVVCGGFPCQDISAAGKGAGINGTRSGLWSEMARIICEVQPVFAFVENTPMLTIRGLGRVLGDLAAMGYDARWGVFSVRDVGGVHLRERIFILATNASGVGGITRKHSNISDSRQSISDEQRQLAQEVEERGQQQSWTDANAETVTTNSAQLFCNGGTNHAESDSRGQKPESGNGPWASNTPNSRIQRIQGKQSKTVRRFTAFPWGEDVRRIEDLQNRPDIPQPLIRRIGNDVAHGVDRLKAIGNGQVPRVVVLAWQTLCR